MLHTSVGDLPLDAVSFNLGVRSRGAYPAGRITLSMLMGSGGCAMHSSYQSAPGDVILTPPGGEQENRYSGTTSLLVTSVTLPEIEATYGGEAALASLNYGQRAQFKGRGAAVGPVGLLLDRLKQDNTALTEPAASFWKRAIMDAMLVNVLESVPALPDGPLPSALRIVRTVDEFLEQEQNRAVHISDLLRAADPAADPAPGVSRGGRGRTDCLSPLQAAGGRPFGAARRSAERPLD
jgi:AraC family ethanolamine operon transcriptional activator